MKLTVSPDKKTPTSWLETSQHICVMVGIFVLPLLGGLTLMSMVAGRVSGDESTVSTSSTAIEASSSRYLLTISVSRNAVPVAISGGALEAVDGGFLVATGTGTFHLAWREAPGDTFTVAKLPIVSPLNREDFVADQPDPAAPQLFRLTDIAVAQDSPSVRLYAAHQYWNRKEKCLTMRVSVAELDGRSWSGGPWDLVYETRPCLRMTGGFTDNETGGKLAWYGRNLLMTVGDHGFSLDRGLAQDTSADYGKILELDLNGGRRIFSKGHRNPQGLLVARDGQIWSTEHGPQGGDEINVIKGGGNYGWPVETYGTQYGLRHWPAKPDTTGASFTRPAYSFTPSIGISAIIELSDGPLLHWSNDLIAGSLVGRSLYRISVSGDRVISRERISVGFRVRDIAQGRGGVIVAWTDEGHLLTVMESQRRPTGEVAYEQCAGCHAADLGGTALGPSLRGLFDRRIGRSDGFTYSPALRAMDAYWTRPRLDAFLKNPNAFANGTTMKFAGIADPAERRALIDYIFINW